MSGENHRLALDVSGLPSVAFGRRNVSWLGNVFYMMIEGTMFALLIVGFFYLRTRSVQWPPAGFVPPNLRYGIASGILLLISLAPAWRARKKAFEGDRAAVRMELLVMALFGVAAMILRVFEFHSLNCRWSDNAYASMIWCLLGLHTGHLITEWIETVAVFGISQTDKMEGMRLADVGMNSDYWYFVVVTGVVMDFIIYGTTRLL